jgi:sugar-specific transcriptional regulator TrmB
MDTSDLKSGLEEAGLTKYQIDAYVTLLELGSSAATDIARRADIPRTRIYDVLDDLEQEGYIETFEQDSLRARAREPTEVFEELQQRAQTLQRTAEEIRNRWQQAGVGGHRVSFVKRMETVFERATEAIESAENHIRLSVTPEEFERLRPVLEAALARDVVINVSLNTPPDRTDVLPDEESFTSVVTEVRHRDLPAPFLLIADRELSCYAVHRPVDQFGAIFEDDELSYVFRWYFITALWEPWPSIYTSRTSTLPVEYVDIRECIQDVAPFLSDGTEIRATIEGKTVGGREERTLSGTIVDAVFADRRPDDSMAIALSQLAGRAALILDTGEEEVSIGGWGAVVEDFEAQRIRLEEILSEGERDSL